MRSCKNILAMLAAAAAFSGCSSADTGSGATTRSNAKIAHSCLFMCVHSFGLVYAAVSFVRIPENAPSIAKHKACICGIGLNQGASPPLPTSISIVYIHFKFATNFCNFWHCNHVAHS